MLRALGERIVVRRNSPPCGRSTLRTDGNGGGAGCPAALFLRGAAFAAGGEGTPNDLCARTVQALDGAEAAAATALAARS